MHRLDFDKLVRRLEALDRHNPKRYRFRVFLLAFLGYFYIFFVLAILALLTVFLPFAILVTGPSVFYILRALWVRITPPDGIRLTREQAPRLFHEVEELCAALHSPRFHEILLDNDFNASAHQFPRFGIFGGYRNYLVLGLPYLMAFSPDQFRAVLAHELAHIFGADGRFGGWAYRIETTRNNLNQRIQQGKVDALFLAPFFRRYSPYFAAHSFVLNRANEYAADRFAGRVAGTRQAADELCLTELRGRFLADKFWPALFKRALETPEPQVSPYSEMRPLLKEPLPEQEAAAWLQTGLNRPSLTVDSHPSLPERLAALGEPARIPPPSAETAAEFFLGDSLDSQVQELNRLWRESTAAWWKERYTHCLETAKQLGEVETKVLDAPENFDLAWERARFTEDLHGPDAALPLFRRCLEINPENANALFAVGQLLVQKNDDSGVPLIEKAMKLESDLLFPGADLLYGYFRDTGRHAVAQDYYDRAIRQNERLQLAQEERARVLYKDVLLPHGFTEAELQPFRQQLETYPQIASVYVARKQLQYFPEKPLLVLGFVWRPLSRIGKKGALLKKLAAELVMPRGYRGLLYDLSADYKLLRMVDFRDSLVYRRPASDRLRKWLRAMRGEASGP